MKRATAAALGMAILMLGRVGAAAPSAITLYVAADGNDGWSGRLAEPNAARSDGPLATIAAARDAVRRIKAQAPGQAITVQVRGGTYFLTEPIVFQPADSGTPEQPITYMAYGDERPVLSGGRPVRGWTTTDGRRYRATVPEARDSKLGLRQLRVGQRRQVRARYPNADPKDPIRGGWLLAVTPFGPAKGFGTCMANIHNRGDYMEWDVEVPADGRYDFWMYCAMLNAPHTPKDVTGCTAISVDGGPKVPLMNLHDTGGWDRFQWRKAATLDLKQGKRRLRWENLKGGGINFDLFALCDDPGVKPQGAALPAVAAGRHFLVVQAEDYVRGDGPQMSKTSCGCAFKSKTEIYVAPGKLKAWDLSAGAEVHIHSSYGWVSGIIPVVAVDVAKSKLVVDKNYPEEVWPGNRFFVENVREELDAPGEWFLDRQSGMIEYMASDARPDQAPAVLSGLDRVIEFRGDPAGKDVVHDIIVRGFTVMDVDYSRDHKCWYYPDGAAVWMIGAQRCRVQECLFQDIGPWALTIRSGSRDNAFEGNTVVRAGMGGVFIDGGPPGNPVKIGPPEARPRGNLVSGNHIHQGGQLFAHVAGVYISSASDNLVRHNLVHHMPRYGLSIKYQSGGNLFEFNHVHHTNLETNDTGGIEIYYNFEGSTVRGNVVADTIGLKVTSEGEFLTPFYSWGIYLDGMTSKVLVENNVVFRNFIGGVMVNGGSHNTIVNNVFVDGHDQQAYLNNYKGTGTGNRFMRNILYARRPEARTYAAHQHTRQWMEVDHNVIWHGGRRPTLQVIPFPPGFKEDPWAAWNRLGMDVHSLVADPGFVNPEADDYRLKPDSPAFKLGFKPIDMDKIGLAGAPVRPPQWHETVQESK